MFMVQIDWLSEWERDDLEKLRERNGEADSEAEADNKWEGGRHSMAKGKQGDVLTIIEIREDLVQRTLEKKCTLVHVQ